MRLHGVNIGHAAQVENIVQFAARHIEQARAAAGRYHRMVIGQRLAIIQRDGFGFCINACNRGFQLQRHIIVAVKIIRFQKQALAFHFTGQISFRQGRALIGQIGFITDKRDVSLIAALAQAHNCLQTGLAGSDNNNTHNYSVSLNSWLKTNKLTSQIEGVIDRHAISLQNDIQKGRLS
ncbi:MAG: Uncharacterised protein [Alphaproteobacteria bacterium]|nr:MAG: Uncharacterised protein [Alphaproteobacteria bacterium]